MESTSTVIPAVSQTDLIRAGVKSVVADAALIARDLEWNKWRAYEIGKAVIVEMNLPADEYERAIRLLTEELKI